MRKGFMSGIILAVLVTTGILSAVQLTSAQGNGNDDSIWADPPKVTAIATDTDTTTTPSNDTNIQAPAPTGSTGAYIAIGDSVAAGLGLPTWSDATAQDSRCGRSPESFVFEVGRQLKRNHVDFACSGATSVDLLNRQSNSLSSADVQIDEAFAQGTPAVMSITVGANDIGWSDLIKACYGGTCGTPSQTTAINASLSNFQANLNDVMQEIQNRSNGTPPTVILTGYYNPVSARCALLPGVTTAEVNWVTNGVTALNTTIKDMATTYGTFARFAPVDFSGHDICSTNPWVQGLNDPAPIHPTAAGQQAIASAVVAAVNRPY